MSRPPENQTSPKAGPERVSPAQAPGSARLEVADLEVADSGMANPAQIDIVAMMRLISGTLQNVASQFDERLEKNTSEIKVTPSGRIVLLCLAGEEMSQTQIQEELSLLVSDPASSVSELLQGEFIELVGLTEQYCLAEKGQGYLQKIFSVAQERNLSWRKQFSESNNETELDFLLRRLQAAPNKKEPR